MPVVLLLFRDISELAVIVECAARPSRLQGGELHVLIFDSHLEAVLPVNPGEVVRDLDGWLTSSEGRKLLLPRVGEIVM